MTPSYQIFDPALAKSLQKPRPRLLEKRENKAAVREKDRRERDKCHVRSGRKCEVMEMIMGRAFRCGYHASENHHLISGIGRRNKGKSILAAHRLDCCETCHADITGKVLVPCDGTKKECAATVRYSRVR